MIRTLFSTALLAAAVGLASPAANAQSQDYFIPGQGAQAQGGAAHRPPQAAPRPAAPRPVAAPLGDASQAAEEQPSAPMPQLQLPPPPELPVLPRGATPPAAVIGVIGVPDIMHASTAFQQVDKIIGERRDRLNADAQKEQAAWRDMEQKLTNDRATLSADQIRARERELQERVTTAQKQFRERGNILQAQAQYGQAQIERALVGIIQRVAESRGMNLVMHRQLVAVNVPEFDITQEVADQLNKVLPSIGVPPEGQMPPVVQPGQADKGATDKGKQDSAKPAPTTKK